MRYLLILILPAVLLVFLKNVKQRKAQILKRLERYTNPDPGAVEDPKKKSMNIYAKLDKKMDKIPGINTIFNYIERQLLVASAPVKTSEFLISIVVLMFTALLVEFMLVGISVMGIIVVIIGSIFMPFVMLNVYIQMRIAKMRKQLKLCISLLANNMKAGNSFIQGLRYVTADMEEPLAGEFRILLNENLLGLSIETALKNMAKRIPCGEMQALVRGVVLQQQTGSNLVHILNTIFQTLQDREEMRNKISVLTIQGKISGFVCGMVPVALFFLMKAAQDGYGEVMLHTPEGHYLLIACGLLMSIGAFFIYKIVAFKF